MQRRELMHMVRSALGGTATQSAAELALDAVVRAIQDGLAEDGEVRLAKFGTFRLRTCRPRRLKNPRTGEDMLLPERQELRFSPSTCPSRGSGKPVSAQ